MSRSLKDVSIVIVTYMGDDLLKDCLESLALTCGEEPQVVVVDNSPSEGTRRLVGRFDNVVYVLSPDNPGFAGGNNRALPYCDREYLLLLNNDTVVHKRESIERLAIFLDEHPKCAVAQGRMLIPTPEGDLSGGYGNFLTPAGILYSEGAFWPDNGQSHPNTTCFFGGGAFLMIKKSVLPQVGHFLFRTHFWSYYEEAEFCHRVWLSGNEVWYVDTPPIDHLCSRTSSTFPRADIMRRYLRNEVFALSSNLGFASRLFLVPSLCGIIALFSLLYLLRGRSDLAFAYLATVKTPFLERKRILSARRQVKRLRKVSDFKIFCKTMRLPPLAYVLRAFR